MTLLPDSNGFFGEFGGTYVGETLMSPLAETARAADKALQDDSFWQDYRRLLRDYAGRPSPLYFAARLSGFAGANIYLKREDLNHTGSHKVNNTVGQALLAKRMGKTCLIAETGAGQHGVATATVAALFGLRCKVFMGKEDIRRQQPNVLRMKLLGAEVVSVDSGTGTLKDAMNEALRYWSSVTADTFYVVGTAAGPHPYPYMVREFQKIIGAEARQQMQEQTGRLPDCVVAAVGGGSNAIGIFHAFLNDQNVELIGAEAAGKGMTTGEHAASLNGGRLGVLHGTKSMLLQDEHGQVREAYSVSAGLDYPGIGPEHAYLHQTKRARYETVTDSEAVDAFQTLCRYEGIIPALESAHALAQTIKEAVTALSEGQEKTFLVCLSGRGDKDIQHISDYLPFSRRIDSGTEHTEQ